MIGLPLGFGPLAGPLFAVANEGDLLYEPINPDELPFGSGMEDPFDRACRAYPEVDTGSTPPIQYEKPVDSTLETVPYDKNDLVSVSSLFGLFDTYGTYQDIHALSPEPTHADPYCVYQLRSGNLYVKFFHGRRGQVAQFPFVATNKDGDTFLILIEITITVSHDYKKV